MGACSKKDDATPAPVTTTYATTWTVDGTNYTATSSDAQLNANTLAVAGVQENSKSKYAVAFAVPAATGTYSLNSGTNVATYTKTINGTASTYTAGALYGGSGTVTITTLSYKEVIGTFSLRLLDSTPGGNTSNSTTITNGQFAIKL